MCDSTSRATSAVLRRLRGQWRYIRVYPGSSRLCDQPIMGVSTRIAQWARTTGIKSYTRLSVQSPTVLSHDLARIATKTVVPVTVVRDVLFFIAATVVERVDLTTDPVTWVAHDGHPVTDAALSMSLPRWTEGLSGHACNCRFTELLSGQLELSLWYAVFRDGDMDGAAVIASCYRRPADNEFVDDNDMVAEPWTFNCPTSDTRPPVLP